jgi:hypothetical protein
MTAGIVSIANDIITVEISGKLRQPELAAMEKTAVEVFRQRGKMRILIIVEDFQGWGLGDDWGDLSFMRENDQYMRKIAIVGDPKWKDLVFIFVGKNYRECPVEYFQPEQVVQARAWLMENSKPQAVE